MPELPEVQTIVDDLNRKVSGRKIVSVWYDWPKMKAVAKTVDLVIERVERRGKNILFYFAPLSLRGSANRRRQSNLPNHPQMILLVHQKMTGHLLVGKWSIRQAQDKKIAVPIEPESLKQKVNGYIHFILKLNDGRMIGLSDLRKFAKVVFGSANEIEALVELKKLGTDALEISLEEFSQKISSRNKTIYQVLMDQTVISGIGNIYASDILWEAKIHPFRSAKKLLKKELEALWQATKKVLKTALKLRGTSTSDYRDTAGEPGGYTDVRQAYDREGMPCFRCGTKIRRVKRGGRSAYFCPRCQS